MHNTINASARCSASTMHHIPWPVCAFGGGKRHVFMASSSRARPSGLLHMLRRSVREPFRRIDERPKCSPEEGFKGNSPLNCPKLTQPAAQQHGPTFHLFPGALNLVSASDVHARLLCAERDPSFGGRHRRAFSSRGCTGLLVWFSKAPQGRREARRYTGVREDHIGASSQLGIGEDTALY